MHGFHWGYHTSVVWDVRTHLEALGHQLTDYNCSGHCPIVFGQPAKPPLGEITNENYHLNDPQAFHDAHPELNDYDFFLTTYPPGFAEFLAPYDKPTIMVVPIRYEYALVRRPERWQQFNEWIRLADDRGRLQVVANNAFDQRYLMHFIGRWAWLIPSTCDYRTERWTPASERAPLLWDTRSERLTTEACQQVPGLLPLRQTYPTYQWATLAEHRAIVHLPYNASEMGMLEHYVMGIPIFAPSPLFLLHLMREWGALSELTFYQCDPPRPEGSMIGPHRLRLDNTDPNAWGSDASILEWMEHYDVYRLPGIRYFDSWDECRRLCANPPKMLADQSQAQRSAQQLRTASARREWARTMESLCRS